MKQCSSCSSLCLSIRPFGSLCAFAFQYWSTSWTVSNIAPYEISSSVYSSCSFTHCSALINASTHCAFISVFDDADLPSHRESVTLVQYFWTHCTSDWIPGISWHSLHIQSQLLDEFLLKKAFGRQEINYRSNLYEGPLLQWRHHFEPATVALCR